MADLLACVRIVTTRMRFALIVPGLFALIGIVARPGAQTISLDEVMKNAAAYLAAFQKQLSGITAEENYVQEVKPLTPLKHLEMVPRRVLRSDLLLVKPAGAERYVELRDVFEVDGAPVRDRQERLTKLLDDASSTASTQIRNIIAESARYNVGRIERNVNTPLLALMFLDAAYQPRFRFKRQAGQRPVFRPNDGNKPDDTPVFRVSTEMWTIEYQERQRPTVIRTPGGDRMPAHGRFWIDPATGAVLISELVTEGRGVRATITVSYQSEPLMGFLVPVEMRESYVHARERIVGSATYGRFRPLKP